MNEKEKPFFVGYLGIPKRLKSFLLFVSLLMLAGFSFGAILAGISQDDPGKAGFRFDYGRQTLTGIIEAHPYPLLHVTKGNDRIKAGQTLMLTGQGKSGIMSDLRALQNQMVTVTGIILERGDLSMLQLLSGERGLKLIGEKGDIPATTSLGRWRLQGEICDGKCVAGAMQPGRGIAHKACANLCLFGDIPPVFVSTQPIDGEEFLLVHGPDGGHLSKSSYNHIGAFIEVEAQVRRHGNLLVVQIDPKKTREVQ